jgi:hypothetical protein
MAMSTELELRFVVVAQIVHQQGCGESLLAVQKTCSKDIFVAFG